MINLWQFVLKDNDDKDAIHEQFIINLLQFMLKLKHKYPRISHKLFTNIF